MDTRPPVKVEDVVKPFKHDVCFIGIQKDTGLFQVNVVNIDDAEHPKKNYAKLREKLGDKYKASMGRKYAVAFYDVNKEGKMVITDFFRCILVDPEYYVRQQIKAGIMTIVVDEFTLIEKWKSRAKKATDVGVYTRLGEVLSVMWNSVLDIKFDFKSQLTKEYFQKNVAK